MSSTSKVRYCQVCSNPTNLKRVHGRERPVCSHCGHIYFQEPKVAAGVLVLKEGKVLLVRRVMKPMRGKWSLPAGFVDHDEDPKQAAVREVLEETGLEIDVEGLIDVFHGKEHPDGANIVIIYKGQVVAGRMNAGDDVDEVDFFDPDNLPPLAFETTRKALKQLYQA